MNNTIMKKCESCGKEFECYARPNVTTVKDRTIRRSNCKNCSRECSNKMSRARNKVKTIILDNNPISIAAYAEEYPENWKEINDHITERRNE